MSLTPYTIDIAPAVIDDLRRRLRQTRWPHDAGYAAWSDGANMATIGALCEHWATDYDWAAAQRAMNEHDHVWAELPSGVLHVVRASSGRPDAIPLVVLHGWPSSFVQMLRMMPMLTAGTPSFDVIVPSLPGFGCSPRPTLPGMSVRAVAELIHELMVGEQPRGRCCGVECPIRPR